MNLIRGIANAVRDSGRRFADWCREFADEYAHQRIPWKLAFWAAVGEVVGLVVIIVSLLWKIIVLLTGLPFFELMGPPLPPPPLVRVPPPTSEKPPKIPLPAGCETPWQIYDFLDYAKDFEVSFHEIYRGKWIPAGCWVLQAVAPADRITGNRWRLNLVAPRSGATVEVRSGDDLAGWRPGSCALVTGRLIDAGPPPPGRFVVDDAKLSDCGP